MANLIRIFMPSYRTKRELRAERDFVLGRLSYYGERTDHVGLSSNEMVRAAITGFPPTPGGIAYPPRDRGDMGRCERTYKRAPKHLKPLMAPYLDWFGNLLNAEGK